MSAVSSWTCRLVVWDVWGWTMAARSSGGLCDTPAGLVGSAHLVDVRWASAPSLLSSELLAGVARLTPSVCW
ncbi:hypothetical protein L210DRAFT_3558593 [Boletus edulis BED1]|uniref:Secreted protein n=1 Tax=Boletus edulis BED1 TaxID=1328754 RepID=A0AAD4GA86_BOLED|nr:hypothetical protein L210DRAFT_3558593 [Boletus edulis BED1]